MTNEQKKQVEEWRDDMALIFRAQYESSLKTQRLNYWVGIPSAVLSAIVGTSIFAALDNNPSATDKIIVGCTSILVVVLTSLQTFLRYSERAEAHRMAGAKFAGLSKELSQILVCPPADDAEFSKWMTSFRGRWDKLSEESPTALPVIWKQILQKIKASKTKASAPAGQSRQAAP